MYSAQPPTFEKLCKRAQTTLDRLSRSYVDDAITYARWIMETGKKLHEEHAAMLANLTATQMRCTQLLEENRRLRRLVDTQPDVGDVDSLPPGPSE